MYVSAAKGCPHKKIVLLPIIVWGEVFGLFCFVSTPLLVLSLRAPELNTAASLGS